MKKTIWIIGLLILAIVLGFFIGNYLYGSDENKLENDIEDKTYNNLQNNVNVIKLQTSVSEEKISVNTDVVEEIYYPECDHLLKYTKQDIKTLVNMTKEELAKKYDDWEIKEFSTNRVVLYKEETGYCEEHYLVKEENGMVTIYNMDNKDNIIGLLEVTDVETKYLTENDQENLKIGIKVYSQQNLNKLIEDFE